MTLEAGQIDHQFKEVDTYSSVIAGPLVIRGIVPLFSSWASILIDTGASHSFISSAFASSLELWFTRLDIPLIVDTPVGGKIHLDQV